MPVVVAYLLAMPVMADDPGSLCTIGQKCFVVHGALACTPDCNCSCESTNCVCENACNPCQVPGGTDCCGNPEEILHCTSGKVPSSDLKSCVSDPCQVTAVTGRWKQQFSIAAPTTITFKHGTSKKNDYTKTTTWSDEVSSTVKSSFQISGFGVTADVSAKVAVQTSDQYSEEWQMDDEEDFQVAFSQDDVGKFVWQFEFAVGDACESGANPLSKEYSLSAGAWDEPCCVPGFCTDAPACHSCHTAEYMLAGADQSYCKVAFINTKHANTSVFESTVLI